MAPLSKEGRYRVQKAGSILKDCMDALSLEIKPGITTKSLEEIADGFINSRGAAAAFRGYKGFPASICISLNNVVVHGIPSEKEVIAEGDIVSVDIGVRYKGYFADAAKTFAVGSISAEAESLMAAASGSLDVGIAMAKTGNRVQDISWAIQSFVEARNFNVVRAFVGHGIGKNLHEPPEIPNFGKPHEGMVFEDGMALAIEPMVNAGAADVKILKDGWTAITKDNRLSAHFEHTVIITGRKAEIVT